MTRLRVWAPNAAGVEVVLADGRCPMAPEGDRGWWAAGVDLPAGTAYRFAVDGGPPRPDPRSGSQPQGVHGPSRVVDHASFAWSDDAWRGVHLPSAVLYELHVGTFSAEGTFDGAIAHLDHLVDLGATAVELMPVAEFSGDHGWGYDGVDLYAPHHAYGGPDGLRRLVDACHGRGLGVILDVVYNHLGPAGNYLGEFGPYFTDRHVTPWGDAVNLDGPHSGGVRDFFVDNALMWLRDYHCDGLRVDAVHAFVDKSAVHFLEELAGRVAELAAHLGRHLFVIAESDLNDPRIVRPPLAGGYGVTASWSDEFHHAIHAALTGDTNGYYEDFGSLAQVAKAFRQAYVYDGGWSPHRERVHGRPPTGLGGASFVVFMQNHDQVGNRAGGERSAALMSTGRVKIAAALVLLSPFVPLLFQGEEWGASTPFQYFTDHADAELGRAVSDGRREEFASFGWRPEDVPDPQQDATFARSKLDWTELDDPAHQEVRDWYRDLIRLRQTVPAFTDGRLETVRAAADDAAGWLAVERGPVALVANIGPAAAYVPLSATAGRVLLASDADHVGVHGREVHVGVDTVAVVALEGGGG
jgi:maltooligosyltrehalose trehalohydrolase